MGHISAVQLNISSSTVPIGEQERVHVERTNRMVAGIFFRVTSAVRREDEAERRALLQDVLRSKLATQEAERLLLSLRYAG